LEDCSTTDRFGERVQPDRLSMNWPSNTRYFRLPPSRTFFMPCALWENCCR
jgi:hypothetical protein